MLDRAVTQAKPKAAHVWDRDPLDWFVEPMECTRLLASVERFVGPVLDPACGQGNIVLALRESGVDASGSDIVCRVPDRPIWFWREIDFLNDGGMLRGIANVVTNPPFFRAKGTEAFIRRALALASGKVAVFVDLKFLASQRRADGLWREHPPARIWQLADRPSCPPGAYLAAGNEAGGGTADWCWLVWDLTAPSGDTRFGWLRRSA